MIDRPLKEEVFVEPIPHLTKSNSLLYKKEESENFPNDCALAQTYENVSYLTTRKPLGNTTSDSDPDLPQHPMDSPSSQRMNEDTSESCETKRNRLLASHGFNYKSQNGCSTPTQSTSFHEFSQDNDPSAFDSFDRSIDFVDTNKFSSTSQCDAAYEFSDSLNSSISLTSASELNVKLLIRERLLKNSMHKQNAAKESCNSSRRATIIRNDNESSFGLEQTKHFYSNVNTLALVSSNELELFNSQKQIKAKNKKRRRISNLRIDVEEDGLNGKAIVTPAPLGRSPKSTDSLTCFSPKAIAKKSGKSKKIRRGKWTDDEHARFLEGLNIHGRQWKKVQKFIPSKSCVQVRTHAYAYFGKKIRQSAATPDQDVLEVASFLSTLSKI